MCGIAGALTFDGSDFLITQEYITKMRDSMIHRGPDGAGIWISADKNIGLGHRRLSIIDLSEKASQPMHNEDSSVYIIFNGEIYNHADIRKELEKKNNHKWITDHSDTEVIVHAFEEWGISFVNKLRGMFAIAIWDNRKKELWLIRDYIGIKPLYYSIHDNRIVFGSEIKAILEDPNQKKELNEESFYHYLSFITTPAPNTMFKGINKLPCGSYLKTDASGFYEIKKYWDVLDHTISLNKFNENEIAKLVLKELRESVELQKVSDVPVGVFLSGGIDSSTNLALFAEGAKNKVKSFTIGYKGENKTYKNENQYAKFMARKVNAEYHEYLLNVDDLINFLPKMVFLQDEPISDPVCVPVYYVSKLARDNDVIVCQVGEGADELFWGYPFWKRMLNLQKLNDWFVPNIFKRFLLYLIKFFGKKNTIYYEWLRRSVKKQQIFWGGSEAFTHEQKNDILSDRLKNRFKDKSSWDALKPLYENFINKSKNKSHLNWMSYLDLNLRLPELLLMRVDKMAMGVSLETRVPFLDHKFVELSMSIPESIKTRRGNLKNILKKAVKGIIPDEIIDRKKQGFGVPLYEWYFTKLGDYANKKLIDFCDKTDLFNKRGMENIIKSGKKKQLWYLLNFVLWWEKYIE